MDYNFYNNFILKNCFIMLKLQYFTNIIIDKILSTYYRYKDSILYYLPFLTITSDLEIINIQKTLNNDFNYIFDKLFPSLLNKKDYNNIDLYINYYNINKKNIEKNIIFLLNKFATTLINYNTLIKIYFKDFVKIYIEIIEIILSNPFFYKMIKNNNCKIIDFNSSHKLLFQNNIINL